MSTIVRVGVLNDVADAGSGSDDMAEWLEREIKALRQKGRITAPVEIVHAYALGLPTGTAEAVEQAYTDLAAHDVVLVIGPGIGDNALVAAACADRFRLPTLHWSAAERARGKYMFQLQGGSLEDEPAMLAHHLAAAGVSRLAILHDLSAIGARQHGFVREEVENLGMTIVASQAVAASGDVRTDQIASVQAASPDAIVYLGLAPGAANVADALAAAGWQGPRFVGTTASRAWEDSSAARLDGWSYLGLHSDANATLGGLCDGRSIGADPSQAARWYDLGRLVAEGIARAPDISREGMRIGLERIKWLPAAQGQDGTLLGFGPQDRGALHGRYLVMRQWREGLSVEVNPGRS